MLDKLMQLQLPHWLIVAGLILVTIGSLGVLLWEEKGLPLLLAETAGDEIPEALVVWIASSQRKTYLHARRILDASCSLFCVRRNQWEKRPLMRSQSELSASAHGSLLPASILQRTRLLGLASPLAPMHVGVWSACGDILKEVGPDHGPDGD